MSHRPRLAPADFRYIFLVLSCVSVLLFPPLAAQAHAGPKRVLILHSYHQGLAWTDDIQAAVSATFAQSGLPLEVHVKYLEVLRFPDLKALRRNQELRSRQLVDQFADRPFDLVLVFDNAALEFVLEHREPLTGNAPMLFCGINNFTSEMLRGQTGITGVAEEPSFDEAIELALRLRPKASRLLVLAEETPTGKANQALLHAQSSRFSSRVEIEVVTETDIHTLEARLAELGPEWLVLPMVRPLDEHGVLSAAEASKRLGRASTVPLIAAWDFWMGHGPALGVVVSAKSQGETAAAMAIRVLKGERAESIPIVTQGNNVVMADHLALTRFGMPESLLPESAVILNAPVSFYTINKGLFWTGGLIGLCLFLLSTSLARNVTRRKRAEELYRCQLGFVETLLKAIPAPVFFKDSKGRYLGVNPAFEALMGKPSSDFIGRLPSVAFPQEHGRMFEQRDQEVLTLGDIQRYEHVMPTALGLRSLTITKAVFPGKDGSSAGIVGILMDITERKQMEDDLRASQERYRALFAAVNDPVLVADRDTGILVECNEAAERYFGRSREQLIGMPQRELHPPQTPQVEGVTEDFKRVTTDPRFKEEVRLLAAGGEQRFVEVTASNFEIGESRLILGVFRDVTERRLAEQALRESESRFKALHNASFGGITIHEKGRILDCNHGLSAITGYAYEELIGMDGLLLIAEQSRELVMANILAGDEKSYEAFGLRKNGEVYPLRLEARNIPYQGRSVRVVEFRDITEGKQAEEALKDSEAKLQNLIQNIHAGVVVHAPDSSILYANAQATNLLGLTLDQMTGKTATDPAWCFIHEDETQYLLEEYPVVQVIATGSPVQNLTFGIMRPSTNDCAWVLVSRP